MKLTETTSHLLPGCVLGIPVLRSDEATMELLPTGDKPLSFSANGMLLEGNIKHEESNANLSFEISVDREMHKVQTSMPILLDMDWQSYVVVPGVMYNGNRFLVSPQPYCPYILTEGVSPNGPIVIADVPRLTADTGYKTELAANALTIPAVGIYDQKKRQGFIIGVQVYGVWGVSGINITTLPGEPIRLEICLPVKREKRYRFCNWIKADNEQGMDILPGEKVNCEIKIAAVSVSSIPDFITKIAEYGFEKRGKEKRKPNLTFAEAAELIENKFDIHNWDEKNGYYRTQSAPNPYFLHTGWVGGGSMIYTMALSEKKERRARSRRMMDVICRNALTPSGYFHGMHDGEHWRSFGVKRPGCRAFSFIRRPVECARDILKTMNLMMGCGERIEDHWISAARKSLDAMVNTSLKFGHLGYTIDFDTGDVLWGDSACGAFAIEPLVLGAAWFKETIFLDVAEQLADYYVRHFLNKGYTCGGVGDALMAVDSESSFALMAGLVHLYDATKNPQHLLWARQAADLFSTWVLSYDAILPTDSPLGKLGIQPRGAVLANIQNQHGAPGICTASGCELLALYEATGEERYLRLLEDIAQCIPQMIVRNGQEEIWGGLPPGSVTERLMTMDGLVPCGHTEQMTSFAGISMLLTVRELPQVYKDTVRGRQALFDVSHT